MIVGVYSQSIKYPGLSVRQPSQELYNVPGMGSITINLLPDDQLTITTPHGEQNCDLFAFSSSGKTSLGSLSLAPNSGAVNLTGFLKTDKDSGEKVLGSLRRRNIDTSRARGMRIFNRESDAGEEITVTSQENLFVVLIAPGQPMKVGEQNPPTDIKVLLKRAQLVNNNDFPLPEPLADPRLGDPGKCLYCTVISCLQG